MTEQQAGEIVAIITAAYPDLTLEREGVILWASLIGELDHHDTARTVALKFARSSERRPSIAAFRAAYLAERRRVDDERARERGLPEPQQTGVPDDVKQWMAEREIGTLRDV